MRVLHLAQLAKVRIWFGGAKLGHTPSSSMNQRVASNAQARIVATEVTLEAFVPQGARIAYGMLGLRFDAREKPDLLGHRAEARLTDRAHGPFVNVR